QTAGETAVLEDMLEGAGLGGRTGESGPLGELAPQGACSSGCGGVAREEREVRSVFEPGCVAFADAGFEGEGEALFVPILEGWIDLGAVGEVADDPYDEARDGEI